MCVNRCVVWIKINSNWSFLWSVVRNEFGRFCATSTGYKYVFVAEYTKSRKNWECRRSAESVRIRLRFNNLIKLSQRRRWHSLKKNIFINSQRKKWKSVPLYELVLSSFASFDAKIQRMGRAVKHYLMRSSSFTHISARISYTHLEYDRIIYQFVIRYPIVCVSFCFTISHWRWVARIERWHGWLMAEAESKKAEKRSRSRNAHMRSNVSHADTTMRRQCCQGIDAHSDACNQSKMNVWNWDETKRKEKCTHSSLTLTAPCTMILLCCILRF